MRDGEREGTGPGRETGSPDWTPPLCRAPVWVFFCLLGNSPARLHQPQSPTGTMVPLPSLDSLGPTGTMAPLPSGCLSSQSPHLRERGTYQSPLRPPSSPITTESRSFHLDMFGELAQSLAQGRPHLGPAAASAHLGVGWGWGQS